MMWLGFYRVRHYVRNSIWVYPVLSMVVAPAVVRMLHRVEQVMGWELNVNPETARTVLGTMASAMFTFIVFVSSALLVAVQLASAQLTPRIIAFVFKEPVTKFSLMVFVFTFSFTLAVLVHINNAVPLLTTYLAAYGCLGSLALFLFMIDHVGKSLRPSGALRSVAVRGHKVIESTYPRHFTEWQERSAQPDNVLDGMPAYTVANRKEGVVLAFDVQGLVSLARRADCVIELVPQVGDFVAAEAPLFRIYEGGRKLPAKALCRSVAYGYERTMEQDPAFAFRIIVDIASKGLSPAINDPTTAVLAIDQIHYLLRKVGGRHLDEGRVLDATGKLRLVYRTPDWEDYVHLAVTEIRHYGLESIQVARRLRAMLENLIQTLPVERSLPLRQELNLLHRSAERFFPEPEDKALADVSDFLGMGGRNGRRQSP